MTRLMFIFEIGHIAALKQKADIFGFTHDWQLFVKGVNGNQNEGGGGIDMSQFIDKVVFYLHDSFPKPKRILKEPPFVVKESGYAGFELQIDIYFKYDSRDDPKKVTFTYDLDLQPFKSEIKEYFIENPSDEFRKKCLKGGCVIVENSNSSDYNKNKDYKATTSSSADSSKKMKKPDEGKSKKVSYFEELFGEAIEKPSTKVIPSKSSSSDKPPSSNQPQSQPQPPPVKDKEKSKSKHSDSKSKSESTSEKSKKDKTRDRDRADKKEKSAKRPASPPPPISSSSIQRTMPNTDYFKSHSKQPTEPSSPSVKKSKKKSNEKEREKVDKKESKTKEKIKFEAPSQPSSSSAAKKSAKDSHEPVKSEPREKPSKTSKTQLSPPVAATNSTSTQPESKKKDKDSEREHKHKRKTKSKDKEKKDRTKSPKSQPPPPSTKNKYTANTQLSDDSDNEHKKQPPAPQPPSQQPEPVFEKAPSNDFDQQRKSLSKKKPIEKEEKSRKRPAPKDVRETSISPPPLQQQKLQPAFESPPESNVNDAKITNEYLQELKELKHKINTIKVNENLQQVIKLIAASGCYEITKTTFDFDLVRLDKNTIQRLQDFLSN